MTTSNRNTKIGEADNKIPDAGGLMTNVVFDTKIEEVQKKIPDVSSLVTAIVLNTKIGEVENEIPDYDKYITTSKFNKFAGAVFGSKLMQANWATNHYLSLRARKKKSKK